MDGVRCRHTEPVSKNKERSSSSSLLLTGQHHVSNIQGEREESNVKNRGQRVSDIKGRGQRVRRQGQKLESQSRVEDRDGHKSRK